MINMGTTAHLGVEVGAHLLAEADFVQGLQRWTTAPKNVTTLDGNTFLGLGSLSGVSGLNESVDTQAEGLSLTLQVVDQAMLALALGNVTGYRDRAVRIYLQLLTPTFKAVGMPVLRWAGRMNKVTINRKSAELASDGPGSGTIELQCTRYGMARARHSQGLRLTDAQQQARYPGDTGLRYVRTLIAQPTRWLSVAFQKQ